MNSFSLVLSFPLFVSDFRDSLEDRVSVFEVCRVLREFFLAPLEWQQVTRVWWRRERFRSRATFVDSSDVSWRLRFFHASCSTNSPPLDPLRHGTFLSRESMPRRLELHVCVSFDFPASGTLISENSSGSARFRGIHLLIPARSRGWTGLAMAMGMPLSA